MWPIAAGAHTSKLTFIFVVNYTSIEQIFDFQTSESSQSVRLYHIAVRLAES